MPMKVGLFTMFAVGIALIGVIASLLRTTTSLGLPKLNNDLVIDLGYQQNQGFVVNDSLVTFRNIRYAASPEGPLRFGEPQPPPHNPTPLPINASDVICPQAFPRWLIPQAPDIPVDPRTSEDCLVLDVLLTQNAWNRRILRRRPVLVWIHGGGFDVGWKDASGAGYGLVSRSTQYHKDGIILVSINYRLGLFGWINGDGVTPNAGLLDQRFALDWVQKYIRLFGGDPSRVTVLGESAGGSSIQAHITAYGGANGSVPFQAAIVQSPYFVPTYPDPRSSVRGILEYDDVPSLDALRGLPSPDLQSLNARLCADSQPFGTFTFGISPNTPYVPNLPNRLLQQRRFDRSITLLSAHNLDEGSRFVPPTGVVDDASYTTYFTSLIPPLSSNTAARNTLTQHLYPPIFDGTQGYTTQAQRNNLTFADAALVCNTRALYTAPFTRATYAYVFSAPPPVHGADLLYTFYDFGDVPGVNATVATVLQGYIAALTVDRNPNARGLPRFPNTRGRGGLLNVGSDGLFQIEDEAGVRRFGERCDFWEAAAYLDGYDG